MSDPRIEKLPKWAREHIATLERLRDEADYRYNKLKGEAEFGCTGKVKRGYCLSGSEVMLPDDDSYRFTLSNGFQFVIRLDKHGDGDEFLNINAADTIDIEPRACNSIYLRKHARRNRV